MKEEGGEKQSMMGKSSDSDRQQKEPTQENSHFFKKISLIHEYKKQNTYFVMAWLPYGINSSAEVFIYLVRMVPQFKIAVFL